MRSLPIAFLAALGVSLSAQAQPVLDSSNYGPVPLAEYLVHNGGQLPPPAMGSNMTWDYSTATFAPEGTQVRLGIPGDHAPANSTVTQVCDTDIYTYFFCLDTTGCYTTGRWCQPADATCSEPVLQMPFPFTMGSTSSFNSFSCPGHEVGLPFAEEGYVQIAGVGFGTLHLPYGSVDDVLLVHRTEYLQHNTTDPNSPIQFNSWYDLEQYFFVSTASRVPLLSIDAWYREDTLYTSSITDAYTVGIQEPLSRTIGLTLFPNPSSGPFTLAFNAPLTMDGLYSVYDALGRLLLQQSLTKGQRTEEVDLSRFGKGTYLIRITDRDEVCNERVVVG